MKYEVADRNFCRFRTLAEIHTRDEGYIRWKPNFCGYLPHLSCSTAKSKISLTKNIGLFSSL